MLKTTLTATALVLAGGIGAAVVSAGSAEAQVRRNAVGYVEACSHYGHGCTSAPVRRGKYGYEYRLPGGTWVGCRRNCRQALREDSVDFWETQRQNQRD